MSSFARSLRVCSPLLTLPSQLRRRRRGASGRSPSMTSNRTRSPAWRGTPSRSATSASSGATTNSFLPSSADVLMTQPPPQDTSSHRRRPLEGHRAEPVPEAQRRDDLGGGRQQRRDPHVPSLGLLT